VSDEELLTPPQRSLTASEQASFSKFLRYAQTFLFATILKYSFDCLITAIGSY
jgi:hypothetical protein